MTMKAIGISGRNRQAAAAVAVDGRLMAAMTSDAVVRGPVDGGAGETRTLIEACLGLAGLDPDQPTRTITVDDSPAAARSACTDDRIGAVEADAALAAMAAPEADLVLVAGGQPPSLDVYVRAGEGVQPALAVTGMEGLLEGAGRLAALLGVPADDPFASLDRLSLGAEPEFAAALAGAADWDGRAAVLRFDPDGLLATTRTIAGARWSALGDVHSPHARLQDLRRGVAASFVAATARLVGQVAADLGGTRGASAFAAGGGLFANPRFTTEVVRHLRAPFSCAPVPETAGRALGAALTGSANGLPPPVARTLALGPAFSEEDIKRTLDNCRLDYVYEPEWPRLLGRVSSMLSQGRIIAWFQGPMTFGPRALGARSILADPSQPYARQNVNQYLRGLPIDEPLPLVFAAGQIARCLDGPVVGGGGTDVPVRADGCGPLTAALDGRAAARVHGPAETYEPRLRELVDRHFAATAVPALIELNLAGPGEPIACSPRDAVRTVYASAIDALVIGRFLLMKDYWLLRSYGT
jgi:carbamoyltransferase